ncbi:late competence development ComFB family protein [Selenomonas sp.]|uniref:late competence development ComFB family protein n=1 Tax=Selenomonas sp. TaxID=2053611 RepID=UPI003FA2F27A
MPIKNTMEEFVKHNLDTILRMYPDCCSCDKCREDIMALALNHLPPKYVSTDKGDLFARISSMDPVDKAFISQEIAKAIQIVHEVPRH